MSYASQDAEAAGRICDALRAAGIEVWFDQSELRGGDAWDTAIRRQIKTCALVIPVISANTESRAEGYFRLEWKLAIDRSHLMAQDHHFLIPVVIDQTDEADGRVPDRFREVQWTRLPDGNATPAFVDRMRRLLGQEASTAHSPATASPNFAASTVAPAVAARSPGMTWLIGAALLLLIGAGAWATRNSWLHTASVTPYSHEDRRMTYAVLPFHAPADDARAAAVATATGDELLSSLESRKDLVSVVPRASAEQAAAHETSMKKLAKELDVHFLVRGTVARDGESYLVTVVGIDGDTERVLTTQTLHIPKNELTPQWRDEANAVVSRLTNTGLQAETKRAKNKPVDSLDVRDLAFRAITDWAANRFVDGKAANANANQLLNKALAMSPDDQYALRVLATVNLCDCVNSWSANPDEQKAIGAAAMEKYLLINPDSSYMLAEKANLYLIRLRWDESLAITETILAREPTNFNALGMKSTALIHLNRVKEAQDIVDGLLLRDPTSWGLQYAAADIYYMQGDYARAAQMAQKATAQMTEPDLKDRVDGQARLTLVAAEARLGHIDKAKAAFADFTTSLPEVRTITAIKKWMHPSADLADFEPLYDGLRLAGVGN